MKILKSILTLSVAAILSACAGTNFSYDQARKVQVGMNESEVVSIMGKPYSVISRPDGQVWVWSYANGMSGKSRAVSFLMKDGQVFKTPSIPQSFN